MPDRKTKRNTPIIKLDAENPCGKGVQETAQIIREGGVVAYPTESFYGLGADPAREDAVNRLYEIKKRQRMRPILVLIPSVEALDSLVDRVPPVARILMETFWPGGLTLVFDAAEGVSPFITAGTGKIGVRLSSHPLAASLVRAVGGPITGTSANRSGMPPCRSAQGVVQQLGSQVDSILDGGTTPGKGPSTVLDVSGDLPLILREGMVSRKLIQDLIDLPDLDGGLAPP